MYVESSLTLLQLSPVSNRKKPSISQHHGRSQSQLKSLHKCQRLAGLSRKVISYNK